MNYEHGVRTGSVTMDSESIPGTVCTETQVEAVEGRLAFSWSQTSDSVSVNLQLPAGTGNSWAQINSTFVRMLLFKLSPYLPYNNQYTLTNNYNLTILALAATSDVFVEFSPQQLRVTRRGDGRELLLLRLSRRIAPSDCTWTIIQVSEKRIVYMRIFV